MQAIPFFLDTIALQTHSATRAEDVGRRVTVREFADGAPCSLYQLHNGDLYCATIDGRFIEGPEDVTA